MTVDSIAALNPHWWIVNPLEDELQQIDSIAKARTDTMRRLNIKNQIKDGYEWDLVGFRGEWAVSLALNIPIRLPLSLTGSKLNDGDLADFIEVNSRKEIDSRFWDLCEKEERINESRLYVLALAGFWPKAVILPGYARGSEFKNGIRKTLSNGKLIKIIDHRKLKPFKSIFDEPEMKQFNKTRKYK